MARVATPLTDKQLKNAKPKDSEYVLSDGQYLQFRMMKKVLALVIQKSESNQD
ncbi:hypothetical protein L4D13_06415 [Photobacterium profundum]|uniref:hypothetical protein n=1 Tax=Photobacterium profundum TaxID=74109 RepID=UPI003D11DEF4